MCDQELPLEDFFAAGTMEAIRDPYTLYRKLRDESPVLAIRNLPLFCLVAVPFILANLDSRRLTLPLQRLAAGFAARGPRLVAGFLVSDSTCPTASAARRSMY